VAVRVIATEPNTVGLYRLEQLVAAGARDYLWLTDAYVVGTNMYVQALRAAAQDGVDVRLLVPSASDIPVVAALSRANYRALLEAGVRVFEWNGPMIHAKTSVVDGKWARVGSTNLNIASWMGNWELDVTIEDDGFAKQMQEMYCRDLEHATEIVISDRKRVKPIGPPRPRGKRRPRTSRKGSTSRAAAGVIGVGSAVGAAITNRRVLGPAEARLMAMAGGFLLGLSIIAVKWPRGITYPLAFIGTWVAIALFIRAYKLRKGLSVGHEQGHGESPPPEPARERR
jgi:cardiolipin synthase